MNREFLERLIEFIPSILDDEFDMSTFNKGNQYTPMSEKGHIGCVIGHATKLEPPIESDYQDGMFRHALYSERVIGMDWHDTAWDFMFCGEWACYDNTKEGAIERIKHILSLDSLDDFTFEYYEY